MIPSNADQIRRGKDVPDAANQKGGDSHREARERHLDETIADSFPASDPPSTDPNPDGDE